MASLHVCAVEAGPGKVGPWQEQALLPTKACNLAVIEGRINPKVVYTPRFPPETVMACSVPVT